LERRNLSGDHHRKEAGNVKVKAAVALVVALSLTACSLAGSGSGDAAPSQPASGDDLNRAVAAAAASLLESPQINIAVVYFDFDNPDEISRYDWTVFQQQGDFLDIHNDVRQASTIAVTRINGELLSARTGKLATESWTSTPDLWVPDTVPGPVGQLRDLAGVGVQRMTDDLTGEPGETTRQVGEDGSELWRIVFSAETDREASLEWIINSDGILQFHRVRSTSIPIQGAETLVFEYGVVDDPEPMTAPEVGTALDITDLGIPAELLEVGL
jgi:hypothetical protein